MPIVLRIKGYRFWFYSADLDEPPHVHVGKDGKEAKYWIHPIKLAKSRKFRDHELNEIKRILRQYEDAILEAWRKEQENVVTTKAKIKINKNYESIVPVIVPDLIEVREFAAKLHAKGMAWKGEAFGWQAEYNPERPEAPLDSKMTFTPADFCIGENGIWSFSLMWEHGSNSKPVEFLDEQTKNS